MTELSHMRLLLVHAPGDGRKLIEDVLAQAGYGDVISNGQIDRTLELCVTERPDVVLLDLGLAGRFSDGTRDDPLPHRTG